MSMENFGIDVKVNVDTNNAESKVQELAKHLEALENFKSNGIKLDLGLSNVSKGTLDSMLKLVDSMKGKEFSKAFEISKGSIQGLKTLADTAEKISKLSNEQINLINTKQSEKTVDKLITKYKQAQSEVSKIQTQMSRTQDGQVLSALGKQLDKYKQEMSKYKDLMSENQKLDIKLVDEKNEEQLERVY